jgi:hypothetical protein
MNAALRPRLAVLLLVSLLLAGCQAAPDTRRVVHEGDAEASGDVHQREMGLAVWMDRLLRVERVGWEVLTGAVDSCPEDEVKARFGAVAMTRYDFGRDMVATAESAFGLGDAVQVLAVFPGSPAERSGVAIGDVVRSVDGWLVPTGPKAQLRLAEHYAELDDREVPVTVVVERDGTELELEVVPKRACAYGIALLYRDGSVNAYADGRNIIVARGMEQFAHRDEELAQVIAHEAAHNALSHRGKRQIYYLFGTILDIAVAFYGVNTSGLFGGLAAGMNSTAYEAEADYVGLYMLAQSGYPVTGAADFWRRMAAESTDQANQGSFLAFHPASPDRYEALEEIADEIESKRQAGLPLRPERAP